MLVFIDESGDPGFGIKSGASPVFVVAMVIFADGQAAGVTERAIKACRNGTPQKPEFKFSKCSDEVRDLFFEAVRPCPFQLRAIVVQKSRIYSGILKSDKERFYEYFVKSVLQHDGGVLKNAVVVIDGSGDRDFRRRLSSALRRRVGADAVRDVKFKKSHADLLVQLADMCAGAIARSYRTERQNRFRWRSMLSTQIRDVWEFK
jgi:hypothetical protein